MVTIKHEVFVILLSVSMHTLAYAHAHSRALSRNFVYVYEYVYGLILPHNRPHIIFPACPDALISTGE